MHASTEEARLFLVCPASQLESFIRQQYGQNSFFLTSLGSVFDFGEIRYAEALTDFLDAAAIQEICLVQDLNCQFLRGVLSGAKGAGTRAESELQTLFSSNYTRVMQPGTHQIHRYRLARLHVLQQAEELMANELLLRCIRRNKVAFRAMLCDKSTGIIEKIALRPEGVCL